MAIRLPWRRKPQTAVEGASMSMASTLHRAKTNGWTPDLVVDAGAALGGFAQIVDDVFPKTPMVLVEPLLEFWPALERFADAAPGRTVVRAAVGANAGTAAFHVHLDLFGSSLFGEQEAGVDGEPRSVPILTLDDALTDIPGRAILLKLDLQGAELLALAGAKATLRRCGLVIVETSLFSFFHGGPLLHDIVGRMADAGFVVYDLSGSLYRPLDGALAQVDLAFVPADSVLRRHHIFASPTQRQQQNAALASLLPATSEVNSSKA